MKEKKITYRTAGGADRSAVKQIVKSAFHDYNFFNVYKPEGENGEEFYNQMMEQWTENGFANATVLVGEMDGKIVSAAVLQSPADENADIIDMTAENNTELIRIGGIERVKAFVKMTETSDFACHSLAGPKWHLVMFAVLPEYEGMGIGSDMLKNCVIPYVSSHGGKLITLNTNTEENRLFYKKNGFEEFDAFYLHDNGAETGNWSYRMSI